MAKEDFEARLDHAKTILERLMDPEIALDESIKAYEEGMKELKRAQAMLEKAQLRVEQIRSSDDAASSE